MCFLSDPFYYRNLPLNAAIMATYGALEIAMHSRAFSFARNLGGKKKKKKKKKREGEVKRDLAAPTPPTRGIKNWIPARLCRHRNTNLRVVTYGGGRCGDVIFPAIASLGNSICAKLFPSRSMRDTHAFVVVIIQWLRAVARHEKAAGLCRL